MIFKTRSYKLVDAIINHPDVRSTFAKGAERLCSADIISDPRNIVYACEAGIIMFLYTRRGVYDGHIGFLRSGRGATALQACRDALDDLFTRFDASAVTASVPLQLRSARMLCRLAGLKPTGADSLNEFFSY